MKSVDSGTFIVFYYDNNLYYRLSSYFNDFSWFRLDQSSLLKITKEEKINQLESLYQSYRKPILETSLEKNTDEVFIMIGNAIKKRENFNSNTVQPNSSVSYRVTGDKDSLLNVSYDGEELNFDLAYFDEDIVSIIPEEVFITYKRKRKLLNALFDLLTREFSITRFYFIEFQGHDCITFFDENSQKLYKS